jgi:hypothetical protein
MTHRDNSKTTRRETAETKAVAIPPAPRAGTFEPEFIRLPKPGLLCPWTGMARSALNELILPTPRNDYKPPVRSFCIRKRGARTGIRLVDFKSLREFILRNEDRPAERQGQEGGES